MIRQPSRMKIESQDPKVFRKIRAISELKDGERFFKMFGALWFLETLRYSTDNSTRITTFECELIGVIKTKQPKRKSNV